MRAFTPFMTLMLLLSFCLSSSSLASSGGSGSWTGEIRPGVMAGNDGAETDFFLDLFFPVWGDDMRLIFLNPHLRFGDEGSDEQNMGLGYRGLYFQNGLILGANVFVDTMESVHDNRYSQFGFGLELLSKWVDLRGNCYFPFSRRVNELPGSESYMFKTLGVWQSGKTEEAPRGIDGEIGVLIPFISDYVETRAYIGGYRYDSEVTDDIEGVKGRVEVRPIPLINLTAEFRDDNFSSSTYIGGYMEIPFSLEALISGRDPFEDITRRVAFGKGSRSLRERMTEKVVRDRHIKTFDQDRVKKVQDVIFVNQDNPSPGDGTYENPYHDVMSASTDSRYREGAWVYIFSSDNNADTYNNVNLALRDDMVLWGQGFLHPLLHLGGGPMPILDGGLTRGISPLENGMSSVITLAENNEVMGLTIQNGDHGIYGGNVAKTYIHDNLIRNNGGTEGSGIHIENLFDGADIFGLMISHRITDNQFLNNTGAGLFINNTLTGTLSVTDSSIESVIAGNTVSGSTADGMKIFSTIVAPLVQNISISNTLAGNAVRHNAGNGIALDNAISALAGELNMPGITALQDNETVASMEDVSVTSNLLGNQVSGNGQSGISVSNDLEAGCQETGGTPPSVTAKVTRASIENTLLDNVTNRNGLYGIVNINNIRGAYGDSTSEPVISIDSSQITNIYKGNFIKGNHRDGLLSSNRFFTPESPFFLLPRITESITHSGISSIVEGNKVMDNGEDGINLLNFFDAGTVTGFTIDNFLSGNTVTGSGKQPLSPWPDMFPPITDGILLNNEGMAFTIEDLSVVNTLSDNMVRDNNGNGISLANSFACGMMFFWLNDENPAPARWTETITAATIVNSLRGNTVTGNTFSGSLISNRLMTIWFEDQPELVMTIENSHIFNNVEYNSFYGNGYDGLTLFNGISIEADEFFPSSVLAEIKYSTINNTMQGNSMNNNGGGLMSDNFIGISAYVSDPSSVFTGSILSSGINGSYSGNEIRENKGSGIILRDRISIVTGPIWADSPIAQFNTSIIDGVMSDSLVNNRVTGNGGTGILLSYFTEASPNLGSTAKVFMERNGVDQNGADGLLLRATGLEDFTANLGDAAAGTGGFNSFAGNGDFDLNNDSALPITAENNWWGQETGPVSGQISTPSRVDSTPWLTAAP